MSKFADEGKSLLQAFPYSLSRDEDKQKIAESIADELAQTISNTDKAMILPCIDSLPESVLDILAVDFKVDWYDVNSPVWHKRQTIKECILVHRFKGTKYAVETALHSMFMSAEVQEWFEYGGEPFHFKIMVYGSALNGLKTLNDKLLYAKNLRSVMDNVIFVLVPEKPVETYFGIIRSAVARKQYAEFENKDEETFISDGNHYFGIGVTKSQFRKYGSSLTYTETGNCNPDSFGGIVFAGGAYGYSKNINSALIYTADAPPPTLCGKAVCGTNTSGYVKTIRLEVDL